MICYRQPVINYRSKLLFQKSFTEICTRKKVIKTKPITSIVIIFVFQKFQQSGGKCGVCGDPYDGPFENDKGGVYDTGIIVRHYPVGHREIEVKTEITAHHKGYITFKLCPNNEAPLTEECLER
mgnify:CR=1 FL=1